eukprot:12910031-Prorocentrum_lima.AAC.1
MQACKTIKEHCQQEIPLHKRINKQMSILAQKESKLAKLKDQEEVLQGRLEEKGFQIKGTLEE